jgi:hypothetical protein
MANTLSGSDVIERDRVQSIESQLDDMTAYIWMPPEISVICALINAYFSIAKAVE